MWNRLRRLFGAGGGNTVFNQGGNDGTYAEAMQTQYPGRGQFGDYGWLRFPGSGNQPVAPAARVVNPVPPVPRVVPSTTSGAVPAWNPDWGPAPVPTGGTNQTRDWVPASRDSFGNLFPGTTNGPMSIARHTGGTDSGDMIGGYAYGYRQNNTDNSRENRTSDKGLIQQEIRRLILANRAGRP